jgi:hypothetical protein
VDTLAEVSAVVLGSSTFDHTNRRFLFWGKDTSNANKLFNVDAPNGSLNSIASIADIPIEFQYDLQQAKLYGLKWDASTSTEYFVTIDIATGQDTIIASIPGVKAIVAAASTFNSNNGTYIFIGLNQNNEQRLYQINASNGSVKASPLLSDRVIELEYDLTDNKLYGLYRESNQRALQLVEVDTQNASIQLVDSFPTISQRFDGVALGTSVYDQSTGTYIFRGVVGGNDSLFIYETQTGRIVTSELTENVIEIECDNTTFASRTYNPQTSLEGEMVSRVKLYPNPAQGEVRVAGYREAIGALSRAYLIGMDARQWQLPFGEEAQSLSLSLAGIPPGHYVLMLQGEKGSLRKKLIKK